MSKKSSPDSSLSQSPIEKDIRIHLVIDNVRSAFNVGSFFRTADGAGYTKLHICGISAYPPNPKIEKTALTASNSVPWTYYAKTEEALEYLRAQNIPIYAVELAENSIDYRTLTYPNPVALVLGHEKRGVSSEIQQKCDKIVHIPMRGKKRTLNVATVAGIILYEVNRSLT